MRIVDLFCGTGGFSCGAHKAGFEAPASYDLDPILTSSFAKNFPKTKLHLKDVATLTGVELEEAAGGEVDGIIGGPPCQGFSDIGRRDVNDVRRKLLGHFFRLVAEVQPKFFVMENVPGLAQAHAKGELTQAIAVLGDRYGLTGPIVLDAAEFGAATRRRRLFVVGMRKDVCPALSVDAIQSRKRKAATVREAINDLAGARRLVDDAAGFDRWKLSSNDATNEYARDLREENGHFSGQMATKHTDRVIKRFSGVSPGSVDKVGRHHRLDWDGQCPTLRAGTGSDKGSYQSVRPIHPEEDRVITVREAARLQGFPDRHVFHPTIWHSFRMIGNSVSPIMSFALLSAIRDWIDQHLGIEERGPFQEAAE